MKSKLTSYNVQKSRKSNIELYRIITMLFIITNHYVVNSGLLAEDGPVYANLLSAKSLFLLILATYGKTAINCFVLISGYFMCKSKITLKKFLKLFLEVEFYRITIGFIFMISGYEKITISGLMKMFLPVQTIATSFTGCYLLFFLCIPFLNILVANMNRKQHLQLLALKWYNIVVTQVAFKI